MSQMMKQMTIAITIALNRAFIQSTSSVYSQSLFLITQSGLKKTKSMKIIRIRITNQNK